MKQARQAFEVRAMASKRAELGQFFTPSHLADFMAGFFDDLPEKAVMLDAGAGEGALTSAFVRHCVARRGITKEIHAVLYEKDERLLDRLRQNLSNTRAQAVEAGICFHYDVRVEDFIAASVERLAQTLFQNDASQFKVAIVNPPYRKLPARSPEALALRDIGIEVPNLYAAFLALIGRQLTPGGQVVAIVPRSFCNGPYFKKFRQEFLGQFSLRRIHSFESRSAAFKGDDVLQENIVIHAVKRIPQAPLIRLSHSSGEAGAAVVASELVASEVLDNFGFLHIPVGRRQQEAQAAMAGLTHSLAELGLSVSTGKVVDFRARDFLMQEYGPGSVPLIYPHHFNGGYVHWPQAVSKKPNAIKIHDLIRPLLVPAGTYVLTKRFSAKEERRRLVACVYDPEKVEADFVGFENHLNFFHRKGGGIERELACGLAMYMNSTMVDDFFRRFSGHTQVNATDLRRLRYPSRSVLEKIGRYLADCGHAQHEIDQCVEYHVQNY